MHVDTFLRQIGEQLNLYPFRAIFEIDPSANFAAPSRVAFCRAFEAAMRMLACTCGCEALQQQGHEPECPYDRLLNKGRPPVFVLNYPGKSGLQNGRLTVGFTLIGDSIRYLPFVVLGLNEMQLRWKESKTSILRLLEVAAVCSHAPDGVRIFTREDGRLDLDSISPLAIEALEVDGSVSKIIVKFVYPVYMEHNGKISVIPEFSTLISGLWKRLAELLPTFLSSADIHDVPGFKEALERVRLVRMKLRWRANIQAGTDGSSKIGGIVGNATYAGALNPFLPLLRMGEWIGVDNGSWMDSGLIRVDRFT